MKRLLGLLRQALVWLLLLPIYFYRELSHLLHLHRVASRRRAPHTPWKRSESTVPSKGFTLPFAVSSVVIPGEEAVTTPCLS